MFRFLAVIAVLIAIPHSVAAQDDLAVEAPLEQRAEEIVAAMRGEVPYDSVFAEGFRDAVPEAQFQGLLAQLEGQLGALLGVQTVDAASENSGRITLRFENATASGPFTLDAEAPFLVVGLLLNDIQPIDDSPATLLSALRDLPGETNLLITNLNDAAPLLAHNADAQMALGSTFKLYVLSALTHSISAGEREWSDVVELSERSFPSGRLQDWPEGAPITLHTLATLMISISDNTATDQLIEVLGREAVEAELLAAGHSAPEGTIPFMTTREMFVLKSGSEDEIAAYRTMDEAARRGVLAALDGVDRDLDEMIAAFTGGPNAIDIEWFASAQDIARVFARIRDLGDETALGILSVNPSVTQTAAEDWQYAGYKGGSEPGVLNLSWLLQNPEGEWFVVTLGWNNPDANVDEQQLELLAMRAISLAAGD